MRVVFGVVVVLLIGLWIYVRRRESKPKDTGPRLVTQSEVARKATPYHAVSIKFDANACRAAKAMDGKRFLSGAAPHLPLPDCTSLECKCRFVHYTDRRKGSDRRSSFRRGLGGGAGKQEDERRKRPERRRDDDDVDSYF